MDSEAAFDKYMRRTSAVLGLAITVWMLTMLPPVRQRTEQLQRAASYKVRYCLRWMRDKQRMPWEKELMGETEEVRRIVLPQHKPGWYMHDSGFYEPSPDDYRD